MTRKTETSAWAHELAARHGVNLQLESAMQHGIPAYKYEDASGPVIVLDGTLPPERQNFTVAHELAHILLHHADEVAPDEEWEANELASELLLPEAEFREWRLSPLRELKARFPHASFEAIARRRLAFRTGGLSIVDNGTLVRRLASEGFSFPPHPVEMEWATIQQSIEQQDDVVLTIEELTLEATYVDEGRGVARVLLEVVSEYL